MKTLLCILSFLFSVACFGQEENYVGMSAVQIKQNTKEKKTEYLTKENGYFMQMQSNDAVVYLFFDDNKICVLMKIVPTYAENAETIKKAFTENCLNISPTEWKLFENNKTYKITLEYDSHRKRYFLVRENNFKMSQTNRKPTLK